MLPRIICFQTIVIGIADVLLQLNEIVPIAQVANLIIAVSNFLRCWPLFMTLTVCSFRNPFNAGYIILQTDIIKFRATTKVIVNYRWSGY